MGGVRGGALGALGGSWKGLGRVLGVLDRLEFFWEGVGGRFGLILGRLGPSWAPHHAYHPGRGRDGTHGGGPHHAYHCFAAGLGGALGRLGALLGGPGDGIEGRRHPPPCVPLLCGRLGTVLGPYWCRLGAFLGPSWAVLGPSWGHLGPSWGLPGGARGLRGDVLEESRRGLWASWAESVGI